ncbi:hypothetical protein HMPREF1587_00163 [Bifidobacterium breve JCP7499]|nr:hypothetical protein HMPREF1587_00163 [Bifidobacterium breve JCP7499]
MVSARSCGTNRHTIPSLSIIADGLHRRPRLTREEQHEHY